MQPFGNGAAPFGHQYDTTPAAKMQRLRNNFQPSGGGRRRIVAKNCGKRLKLHPFCGKLYAVKCADDLLE
jgi:hypothetical protein